MKHLAILLFLVFTTALNSLCFGQIRPMEFTQKVTTPESSFRQYKPKLQIINDTLFVSSNTGVYMKDLIRNSDWELYAFEEAPIIEFVRNGNHLLANSMGAWNERDRLLLFSGDNGKTYVDYTSSHFLEYGKNHLYRIAQNPQNPNVLLILSYNGVSQSENFGKNWVSLYPYSLGYDIAFISYHPLDATAIFYSGETGYFSGRIYSSYDNGATWANYEIPGGDNCVHQIAFHPTNPNIMIFGGEGVTGKSIDKGKTWKIKNLHDTGMYFFKVLFDEDNPTILYASGAHGNFRENHDFIQVYRSADTGETWHLAYDEKLDMNCGGVIDMLKYKNKLIFYTRETGLFELDLETTPIMSNHTINIKPNLSIYPNPVQNTLYFNTEANIERIEIIDWAGRVIQKNSLKENEKQINVSNLGSGVYFIVFYNEQQVFTKKIVVSKKGD